MDRGNERDRPEDNILPGRTHRVRVADEAVLCDVRPVVRHRVVLAMFGLCECVTVRLFYDQCY